MVNFSPKKLAIKYPKNYEQVSRTITSEASAAETIGQWCIRHGHNSEKILHQGISIINQIIALQIDNTENSILQERITAFDRLNILSISNWTINVSPKLRSVAGKANFKQFKIILHPALEDPEDPVYSDRFNTFFHELS